MINISLSQTVPLDSIPFITKFNISSILPSQSILWDPLTSTFVPYTPLVIGDITPLLNNKAPLIHTHTISDILNLPPALNTISQIQTQDFIASPNSIYFIDSSLNPISISLPSSPPNGTKLSFVDFLMSSPSSSFSNSITVLCSQTNSIFGSQSFSFSHSFNLIFINDKWLSI